MNFIKHLDDVIMQKEAMHRELRRKTKYYRRQIKTTNRLRHNIEIHLDSLSQYLSTRETCPVCHESNELRLLKCRHLCCHNCLEQIHINEEDAKCPLCRERISNLLCFHQYEESDSDSDSD